MSNFNPDMPLDIPAMIASAQTATGLTDWGSDQSWRIGLDVFVSAIEAMPATPALRSTVRQRIGQILETRLRLETDARAHPDIIAQTIERPMIVIGLPRTGTTITYDLLTQDPASRAPREFELYIPWPASDVATFDCDPRIGVVQAMYDNYLAHAPELASIQRLDCTQPGECNHGMTFHFAGSNFWAEYGIPLFAEWIKTVIPEGLYRTHKRLLQQFQWKGPKGRWVMKSPHHLFDLEGLIDAYPDAGLIWTHRDPVSTFSSLASMVAGLQKAIGGGGDKQAIGQGVFDLWSVAMARATKVRESNPAIEARIIDLAHRDVVHDPKGAMRRIYERFDVPFSDDYAARIEHFLTAHPAASRLGKHKHSAEEYGIDPGAVHERLADYYARFGPMLAKP
jgi:Sulfotransferase family